MEIDLIKISKKYHYQKVLDNITYSFKNNKVYFIIGESGCGKSTLLKIMAGIINDYNGKVLFDGKDIRNIDQDYLKKDLISYVDQNSTLLKYLSIDGNADFLINKKININNHKMFSKYSGGEKRRIAAYVSSLKNSKVILADEVSSSLDKENAILIMNYLRETSKNKILIVVTHDKFLIHDEDIVIDLNNFKPHKNLSKRFFKYQKKKKEHNIRKILKYAFLKMISKIKSVFSFTSSFMVGLTLILLISSLKTGIMSFLNEQLLKNFNFEYLLIESDDYYNYGFMNEFQELSKNGTILMDDINFDPIKNMIYTKVNNELIYFELDNQYSVSKDMLIKNNYSNEFNINNYILYIKNLNEDKGNVIHCPPEFFNRYYQFKGYKINDFISKECVLKVNQDYVVNNYDELIKKYPNYKLRSSGIDAYVYINEMLNKIEIILLIFILISLLVTFFLILTIIKLEIMEDTDEIKFMYNSGLSTKFIFTFYYFVNLYRGLVTLIITSLTYYGVITFSNYILAKELEIDYNILGINLASIEIIMALIIVIITLSMFLTYKRIKFIKI